VKASLHNVYANRAGASLMETPRGYDWRDDAACQDSDPEAWFPLSADPRHSADALAVCRTCPVLDDCRDWAIATRQEYGVWGGLTEDQLRALKRKAGRGTRTPPAINHGTEGGAGAHRRRGEEPCSACLDAARRAKRGRDMDRRRKRGAGS